MGAPAGEPPPMHHIAIDPLERSQHAVTFRWRVTPATPLYRTSEFTLQFPDGLDLSPVPDALWWTVALSCLHPHWALLRPCRIDLPIALAPSEVEVWQRLLDAAVFTLESLRGTTRVERDIEIVADGPRLDWTTALEPGRCATAFSGGKDSLVQTALLTELTPRPVLVTTTSPMLPFHDHLTARRRHVLREILARRDVTLVEVKSDYRATWTNEFPHTLGYPVSVNELTDTFLYFGALLAAAVALGVPHLFLASETEVQENADLDGRVVQHPHFMYSTVTQRALAALLKPAGIRYSSLTAPLHSEQVQQLLWTRYRDLRDLQYSCWQVPPDEATCSRCPQCLRLAMGVLALGDNPAPMGVNLPRLLRAMREWEPRRLHKENFKENFPPLPQNLVGAALQRQTVRAIRATPLSRVGRAIVDGHLARVIDPKTWLAIRAYAMLRRRLAAYSVGPAPGFRAGFLSVIDPFVRDRVGKIFAAHFSPEEESSYAAVLARGHALARWITEPVGGTDGEG